MGEVLANEGNGFHSQIQFIDTNIPTSYLQQILLFLSMCNLCLFLYLSVSTPALCDVLTVMTGYCGGRRLWWEEVVVAGEL